MANCANLGNHSPLTDARRKFLEVMRRENFCVIEGLQVRDNDPVLDPPPVIIKEIKFTGDNSPRTDLSVDELALRPQGIELLTLFDQVGDGVIDRIEVKHALAFRAFVRRPI